MIDSNEENIGFHLPTGLSNEITSILENVLRFIYNSDEFFDTELLAAELKLDEIVLKGVMSILPGGFIVNENGKISLSQRGKFFFHSIYR